MKSLVIGLALFLLMPTFAAVDVTGTWNGTLTVMKQDGTSQSMRAWAEFKQNGGAVSGFMGDGPEDRHAISEATIKDNKLSLKIMDGGKTILFALTIDGNQINGTGSRVGTGETATLKLSRQK
jgi:hypothetical protein